MKKAAIVVIIACLVGAGVLGGSYFLENNKKNSNNTVPVKQVSVNKSLASNTNKTIGNTTKTNSISDQSKQKILSPFMDSKSITAQIAGNIGVTILPNTAKEVNGTISIEEYYNQYANQIMMLNVTSSGVDSFTMNESQNGTATGIYKMKFVNKNLATGTFENVATKKVSTVTMTFTQAESTSANASNNSASSSNAKNNASSTSSSNSNVSSNNISGTNVSPTSGYPNIILGSGAIEINGEIFKEPTAGFIRNQVTNQLNWPTKILSDTQYQEFLHGTQNQKMDLFNEYGETDYQFLEFGAVNFNTPNSNLAGAPDYIINGMPAYYVNAVAGAQLDGGNMHADTLIGFNGHIYTESEISNAIKNGTFLYANYQYNNSNQVEPPTQYTVENSEDVGDDGFGNNGSGGYFSTQTP